MSGASGKPRLSPTPPGSGSEPAPNVPAIRRIREAKRLLIGRPLRSDELEALRPRKWLAFPIFSCDLLSHTRIVRVSSSSGVS